MRCRYYTRLFGSGDALTGAAVFIGFTEPDLDNDQGLSIRHDQVEFPLFTTEISAYRFKPLADQKLMSLLLGAFAPEQVRRFGCQLIQQGHRLGSFLTGRTGFFGWVRRRDIGISLSIDKTGDFRFAIDIFGANELAFNPVIPG